MSTTLVKVKTLGVAIEAGSKGLLCWLRVILAYQHGSVTSRSLLSWKVFGNKPAHGVTQAVSVTLLRPADNAAKPNRVSRVDLGLGVTFSIDL